MRLIRAIKWMAVGAVTLAAASAGVLYLLASSVPEGYRPAQLSADQQREVAYNQFTPHVLKFGNEAQGLQPFTWTATAEQVNSYLASMDEIAAIRPGHQRGQVDKALADAGLAEPAVAFEAGAVTLMVRSTRYNKILSADVGFSFRPDGRLAIALKAVRVGYLPVPKSQVRQLLERLKRSLAGRLAAPERNGDAAGGGSSFQSLASQRVAELLGEVIAAIDEQPVGTEIVWPVGKKRVRIDAVDIADGALTLHATPMSRSPQGE